MTRSMDRMTAMGEGATGQLREKAGQVGDSLREMADATCDAGREQLERGRERASEYYEDGRERARRWEESLEAYVQDRPLKALIIAAGVGMFVGLIWRRR